MNGKEKIELLAGIKSGAVSLRELSKPMHKCFFVKGEVYTDQDTGIRYSRENIPKAWVTHFVRFKDCSGKKKLHNKLH